jgi:hypothetical protein
MFADYGVADDDTIFAIPEAENPEQTRPRWLRLSEDQEHCERLTNTYRSGSGRREYMRLRDLAMMRTECSPRKFRRFVRVRSSGLSVSEAESGDLLTVIPESPSEISTSPLPLPW